ncbi:AAA family ATPase [Cognatiyoonia sp. IB215446]|uniref:ATP-binding protein n=1 Tax=Cognatiyoonia sp. IB215446 TaxID=3097355 RepID=UPI002A0E9475|nr:AAA family ATPase [Cognatiyoonia sp. IB215446]MDX8350568.1 AAA family ATPase [Cognatiyoonia sp. IB215446]
MNTHFDKQPTDLGERRQVSVLFADMVGYTATVAKLGEEQSVAFVRIVYDMLTRVVVEHGGTVRDFAGDSIMALFGIPDALEDPALRACRAAVAIHAAFADAAADLEAQFGVHPVMRVGISSGDVVMAAVRSADGPATAVGSTVNLASRIEQMASPAGTMICDTTQALVSWVTDLTYFGEEQIKGFADPQKIWVLDAVHARATRFDASIAQGLSNYVGRQDELNAMAHALTQVHDTKQVIDLVAEPGLGKTRLVFEFLRRIGTEEAVVLRGHCFADGQNTPFLPLLEIIRSGFLIRETDEPERIAEKLEAGLKAWDCYGEENHALLLNLLGLKPPAGVLEGLDGVLIGLRTRELLPELLRARCVREKVVLLIEDCHWIDTASEALLRDLVDAPDLRNFLIIQTRRPEYTPPWLDAAVVKTLALQPLGADDIAHLAQYRLGVETLPDALARQLSERAGGNPLFGEEILSFLLEQGALRIDGGAAHFDVSEAGSHLPLTMRSLLTARVAQLQPKDQELLQAASVIGRRFSSGVLSGLVDGPDDIDVALDRLQAQDVLYREAHSPDYIFKHALLRDCVYQSLVATRRSQLHLAVADALAARSANRLQEAAETLAFHYAQTSRNDEAFRYSAMAAEKSLGVYSLDEANGYFTAALALYQSDPTCATDAEFASFLSYFALCANISLRVHQMIALAGDVRPILARIGDNPDHALFLHHYIACLVCNGKYYKAHQIQQELTGMAKRLGDPTSLAYAMVSELSVSIYFAPMDNADFAAKTQEIEANLKRIDDAYIQNFFLATLGWNELTRGRVARAHAAAERMIVAGTANNDPRSLGYGTAMKALTAMVTDNHALALEMAEEARNASKVEFELAIAEAARVAALVPLQKPEAPELVQAHIAACEAKGWTLFTMGPATMLGVAFALKGEITAGLQQIEAAISKRSEEGTQVAADWARLFLCELYLAILTGEGDGSLSVLFRNLRAIIQVRLFGEKRLIRMIEQIRQNPQFDDTGHYIARCDMILGLLYKAKKKPDLARDHLTKAQVIVETSGASPMLTRINDALAELA